MANLPYTTRNLYWLGDTKDVLSAYPPNVKRVFGFALRAVQNGEMPSIAKPLKGLGAGVLELVHEADKNAYRVVYALRIGTNVYVIDVFKKKSKTGSKTPKNVKNRIEARLKLARALEKGGAE
jgi:phage-related protein